MNYNSTKARQTSASHAAWWMKDACESGSTRLVLTGLSRLKERRALKVARVLARFFSMSVGNKPRANSRRFFAPLGWEKQQFRQFQFERQASLARLAVDSSRLLIMTPAELIERTAIVGLEHIEAALSLGRGLLLFSGHMGSFPILPAVLSSFGYKTATASRPIAREKDQKFLSNLFHPFGSSYGFAGKNALGVMRESFQRNQCFLTFFDVAENVASTSNLSFGHVQMRIAAAPALLAIRCRVPVAYASTVQLRNGCNRTTITPVNFDLGARLPDVAAALNAQLLQLLFQDVMAHPAQWWMWAFQDLMMDVRASIRKRPPQPRNSSPITR